MRSIHSIEVNGVKLGYEVRREQGDAAPPLVFVHGYAMRATGLLYDRLLDDLARDFVVYALDLRGHGRSNTPQAGRWSLAANADDVAAFIDALNLKAPVYVGHSIGGFTGLLAELRHPRTFPVMALLATASLDGGQQNPQGIADLFVAQGRNRTAMSEVFRPMYRRPAVEDLDLATEACAEIAAQVHADFFPEFQTASLADRLGEIRSPVLLVNGAQDNVVPPDAQHRTAAAIGKSKEVILSEEGHMLPVEVPELCAREIRTFVHHDASEMLAR